jgi:hypothetical protein
LILKITVLQDDGNVLASSQYRRVSRSIDAAKCVRFGHDAAECGAVRQGGHTLLADPDFGGNTDADAVTLAVLPNWKEVTLWAIREVCLD